MFLEQGVIPQNHFYKYLLGSLAVIIASSVGQLPMLIAIYFKAVNKEVAFPSTN